MQIKLLDIINELEISKPIIIAKQCPNPLYIEINTSDNPWLYLSSRNLPIHKEFLIKNSNNYIIHLYIGDKLHIEDLEKFKKSLTNKGIRFLQTGSRGGGITKKSKYINIIINERYFKIIDNINELEVNTIPNFGQDLEKLKKWLLKNKNNFIKFINVIPFNELNWSGLINIKEYIKELIQEYIEEELIINIYEDEDEDPMYDYLFINTSDGDTIDISFINSFEKNIKVSFGSNLIFIKTN